jgi:DNA polymerase I-like protein with 3'-5' exonuclease and polymerase domains
MSFYVMDFETGPYNPELKTQPHAYALEPYREEFFIKYLGICKDDGSEYQFFSHTMPDFNDILCGLLEVLAGQEVYAHNAGFEIMCCLSANHPEIKQLVRNIRWRDSALLCKWVENSQANEHNLYSLAACVERWLPDEVDFLSMKDSASNLDSYWKLRVKEDVRVTARLVTSLLTKLPPEMTKGFIIEQNTLVPFAEATMQGILLDVDAIELMELEYNAKISRLCREAGVTESLVSSPAQLADLLFNQLGLTPKSYTATGKASTRAGDLKYLILEYEVEFPILKQIQVIKQLITVRNKYAAAFMECVRYGGNKLRPRIKLFNSYTGRATYSSKLSKKFPVAIALHQLPRKFKDIKRVMIAPAGYRVLYADFASQEIRVMAEKSRDVTMVQALNENKDLHAIMAEGVFGTPYDTIVAEKDTNDGIKNQRDGGKMINLSSQYRIGHKTFVVKAFEQYDKIITEREAKHYLSSYKSTFKGIPLYWTSAIKFAHANGYAESFSKRRFVISDLDWQGESSAINMPIQGSGADLTELVVALVAKKFPDLVFQVSVHDSLTWLIPDAMDSNEVRDYVNSIPYSVYYGIDFAVTFPMDFAIGPNFADLKGF